MTSCNAAELAERHERFIEKIVERLRGGHVVRNGWAEMQSADVARRQFPSDFDKIDWENTPVYPLDLVSSIFDTNDKWVVILANCLRDETYAQDLLIRRALSLVERGGALFALIEDDTKSWKWMVEHKLVDALWPYYGHRFFVRKVGGNCPKVNYQFGNNGFYRFEADSNGHRATGKRDLAKTANLLNEFRSLWSNSKSFAEELPNRLTLSAEKKDDGFVFTCRELKSFYLPIDDIGAEREMLSDALCSMLAVVCEQEKVSVNLSAVTEANVVNGNSMIVTLDESGEARGSALLKTLKLNNC
jgi:hypothetical protein